MKNLRPSTIKRMYTILDETYFTKNNFDVDFKSGKSDNIILKITFVPEPSYYYVIKDQVQYQGRFIVEQAPSPYFLQGDQQVRDNFDSCLNGITEWANRILEDYRQGSPIFDELDELRKSFEEKISAHIANGTAHFDEEEKKKLQQKMDELVSKFQELQQKNEITEKQLGDITTNLERLSKDLETFPKVAWYRTAGSRIFQIIKNFAKSKEGRELIASTVKGFLTGGVSK